MLGRVGDKWEIESPDSGKIIPSIYDADENLNPAARA
jgi:hypothetical protein